MAAKRVVLSIIFLVINSLCFSATWEDWDLGGELGLGVGSGSQSGKVLSPALRVTGTRQIGNKFLELGLGYMFGSEMTVNYTAGELERTDVYDSDVVADAGQEVKVRMSVIPMTVNFYYPFYQSFYIGAGIGLYHIFYKREPTGDWRVTPDSERGEIVKSPATTALGFQQMVCMRIFPMSPRWHWFVGIKSFVTTSGGAAGSLMGITLGGKLKYTW